METKKLKIGDTVYTPYDSEHEQIGELIKIGIVSDNEWKQYDDADLFEEFVRNGDVGQEENYYVIKERSGKIHVDNECKLWVDGQSKLLKS